jgi:hypothetical protein
VVTGYTLDVRSGRRDSLRHLRSCFVAEDGRIHATGEDRSATAADPLVVSEELGPTNLHR